jgi:hypothetical protein
MSGFNFRRFLLGQPAAEDPLERLVELGRAEDPAATPHPTRQIAELKTQDEAAPLSLASVDKKVVDVFEVEAKRAVEAPRSRSGYVWVSQKSRSSRAGWADFVNRTF